MRLKIERGAFELWLSGLPPDVLVGSSGGPRDNPVAHFLADQLLSSPRCLSAAALATPTYVAYDADYAGGDRREALLPAPGWVRAYLSDLAEWGAASAPLTQAAALELLYQSPLPLGDDSG